MPSLGMLAAFLTAFYSWRLLIMTFHGAPRADHHTMEHVHESPLVMLVPLMVLAVGAVLAGYIFAPLFVGEHAHDFWHGAIFNAEHNHILHAMHEVPEWVPLAPTVMGVAGIALAYMLYMVAPGMPGADRGALPRGLPVPAEQVVLRRALRRDLRAAGRRLGGVLLEDRRRARSSTACRTARPPRGRRSRAARYASRAATCGELCLRHDHRPGRLQLSLPDRALMMNAAGFPLLSLVTFLPLAGALIIMSVRGDEEVVARNARWTALWTSLIVFLLSLILWVRFDRASAGFQFEEKLAWLPEFGVGYHMGVDGISVLFVLLSTALTPLCILACWEVDRHPGARVHDRLPDPRDDDGRHVLRRSTSSSSTSSSKAC